ncbi:hypothetical protein HNP99_001941 [Flavobacterium sp. 28A]|uniref:2TM domain-containing protein n=1 Tax=Flavobacterium sp. 28A TaxID=2735895 RepID=UPI0015715B5C|nr:2TM domain-containing protein [Flavobacterium sp. 28A]NRT15584.1 hypothetical protein [Flavobacterium sp. 28A]
MIETNQNSDIQNHSFELARKKVQKLKTFYIHFIIYLIGLSFFILKEYFKIGFTIFPFNQLNSFVMAIWTGAFLITLVDTVVSFVLFGKKWEDQKLAHFMKARNKTQKWK